MKKERHTSARGPRGGHQKILGHDAALRGKHSDTMDSSEDIVPAAL